MAENPDTSKAWPYWILRFMVKDDDEALEDLVWSVGGSPPYGGISYEEAAAVYQLIEDFRGKGLASPVRYKAVRKFIKGHAERERALDLFECYDKIVSASETYPREVAARGLDIARSIGEPAAIGLFKLFHAQVLTREDHNGEAAALTVEALDDLLVASQKDPGCSHRVEQAAQNAVTLTALAGDMAKAIELLESLSEVLPTQTVAELRRWISAQS